MSASAISSWCSSSSASWARTIAASRSFGGAPGPSGAGPRIMPSCIAAVCSSQQREREPRAVAEAAEQRALADACLGGDRVHRDVLDPAAAEQPLGRRQHLLAVALRVGALARLAVDEREVGWGSPAIRAICIEYRSASGARRRERAARPPPRARRRTGRPGSARPPSAGAAVAQQQPAEQPGEREHAAPISAERWNASTPASCDRLGHDRAVLGRQRRRGRPGSARGRAPRRPAPARRATACARRARCRAVSA